MKNLEIGIVQISYDESGNIISASFNPTMEIDYVNTLSDQLKNIQCAESSSVVKSNADMVLSAFFSTLNDIELADREKYELVSEVLTCSNYPNGGSVQTCSIKYTFQEKLVDKK